MTCVFSLEKRLLSLQCWDASEEELVILEGKGREREREIGEVYTPYTCIEGRGAHCKWREGMYEVRQNYMFVCRNSKSSKS